MKNNQDAIQEAMRLAQTGAGRQLIALLQNQNSTQLQQALASASTGNYDQAKQALAGLMENPEIRALLSQMGGTHGPDGR